MNASALHGYRAAIKSLCINCFILLFYHVFNDELENKKVPIRQWRVDNLAHVFCNVAFATAHRKDINCRDHSGVLYSYPGTSGARFDSPHNFMAPPEYFLQLIGWKENGDELVVTTHYGRLRGKRAHGSTEAGEYV